MKAISIFSLAIAIVICASCKSKDANDIILQAESDARQIVSAAEVRAKAIIETAGKEAKRIIKEAEDEAERILEEAEDEAESATQDYPNSTYSNSQSSSAYYLSLSDLFKIVEEYEDNAAAADIKYKGIRIITDFEYFDIKSWNDDSFLIEKSSGLLLEYNFVMKESQKEVVASLNKDQWIKIAGTLNSGSRYSLWFKDCVILEVMEDSPNK